MKNLRQVCFAACLLGCGASTDHAAESASTAEGATPIAPVLAPAVAPLESAAPTRPTPEPTPEPTEPTAQPVELDLLHAVRSDLAVSSAYRNQSSQAASLIDGNLETAWNSRTGELVGAAIEVRLPADVHVSALAMTAGFTHMQRDTDLFLGNHRVARIRVLHEGTEVGSFPLDVNVRTLQRIPLEGTGGVYRIEVTEVLAGARDDWRETCI